MSLALSVQPSVLLLPLPFAHSYRAHDVAAAAAPLRDHSPLASPLPQPLSAVDRDSAVWRETGTAMSKCGQPRGIYAQVLRVTRPRQNLPPDRARVASLLFPAVDATFPPIALVSGPDPSPPSVPAPSAAVDRNQHLAPAADTLPSNAIRLHASAQHQAKGPQRNLRQHPPHFFDAQHHRQLFEAFGACRIDLQILLEHLGLQKENRRKCSVLRTGCDVPLNCQIRKKSTASLLPSYLGCRHQPASS